MKKYIACLLVLLSVASFAEEEECEAAVDAASRVNPNQGKNCDYSNTGLNGVLHRALAKKQGEQSAASSSSVNTVNVSPAIAAQSATPNAVLAGKVGSAEFSSAKDLDVARYELVRQAEKACSKGFVVQGERYIPAQAQSMRLELLYYCL